MSVVVTGWGALTGSETPLDTLLAEPPAAPSPAATDAAGFEVRLADEPAALASVPKRHARKMDRISRLTTAAVGRALEHAGVSGSEMLEETGLVLTTTFGSAGAVCRVLADVLSDDPVISPLIFPNVVANAAAGQASIAYGLRGPNSVLGGVGGLMYAYDLLSSGRAQRLVVGGFDELTPVYEKALAHAGFHACVSRLSEGAAVIVLETDASAARRGAVPLAELADAATATDLDFALDGRSSYSGDGMRRALSRVTAGRARPDLLIGSGMPGTGLREIEMTLVRKTGASWPKEHTGEMFACSAALNVLLAVMAIAGAAPVGSTPTSTPRSVLVTGHDSTRGQSEAALFRATSSEVADETAAELRRIA